MPGSPLDPRAEGTNGLLKQGATLVTEAADVLTVLRPILGQPIELPLEEPDAGARRHGRTAGRSRAPHHRPAGPSPVSIDDLMRLSQSSPAIVRTVLLELEIAGRLRTARRRARVAGVNCPDDSSHTRRHSPVADRLCIRAGPGRPHPRPRLRPVRRRTVEGRTGQGHLARHIQQRLPGRHTRPARDRHHQAPAGIQQARRRLCDVDRLAAEHADRPEARSRSGAPPSTRSRRSTASSAGSSWRSGAWRPPTAR